MVLSVRGLAVEVGQRVGRVVGVRGRYHFPGRGRVEAHRGRAPVGRYAAAVRGSPGATHVLHTWRGRRAGGRHVGIAMHLKEKRETKC